MIVEQTRNGSGRMETRSKGRRIMGELRSKVSRRKCRKSRHSRVKGKPEENVEGRDRDTGEKGLILYSTCIYN